MLLKIYLAGLLLSFLLTILYYWLVETDAVVIDIVAAMVIISSSWIGVFLFVISSKAIILRAKEKRERKINKGKPSLTRRRKPMRAAVNDPVKESVTNPVATVFSVNRDQLN